MKVQTKKHNFEPTNMPGPNYKYKCKVCQQEWKKLPKNTCPGVRVFFSRDPQGCPEQYKTLAELEMKGLRPRNEGQPIAAFRASRESRLVLLYDETQAILSTTQKKVSTIVYYWFYRLAKLWRHRLGVVATIIEWSIVATLTGFSKWSQSAPLVVFVYQHLIEALIIGGIVLAFSCMSVIAVFLPEPQEVNKGWRTPHWVFSTVTSAMSNTLFVILLVVVFTRPSWCPPVLCPAPQRILITHPQGNHDDKLEMYFTALQSKWYVIPSDPTHYTLDHLPERIGALRADGHDSPLLYHLILGLQSLQEGRFGMIIEKVELVVRQVSPIPHPLNIWNNPSLIDYENNNQYRARYAGQEADSVLPADYLRFKNGFVHLNPGETDHIDIHIVSRVEADIQFSVQVIYRVDNESPRHMLKLPCLFEVIFASSSDWHTYQFLNGHFVAES